MSPANTYYPFGMLMPERNWSSDWYRYGFQGQEKDDEIKGEGNSVDFGAKFYDSRLGRWGSIDELKRAYPKISDYTYVDNNPIIYVDLDGKRFLIPNKEDRKAVLKMINSRARGVFDINKNGELVLINEKGSDGYSEYYRDKLIEGINDDNTIYISIGEIVNIPSFDHDKGEFDFNRIGMANVDIGDFGEGLTVGKQGTNQIIFISGKSGIIFDESGNRLRDEAADVLVHEIVGHAVPKAKERNDYDPIKEENKVRKQYDKPNDKQRAPESAHPK